MSLHSPFVPAIMLNVIAACGFGAYTVITRDRERERKIYVKNAASIRRDPDVEKIFMTNHEDQEQEDQEQENQEQENQEQEDQEQRENLHNNRFRKDDESINHNHTGDVGVLLRIPPRKMNWIDAYRNPPAHLHPPPAPLHHPALTSAVEVG